MGILTRRPSGRQVYYQANPDCPIFQELRTLIVKTAGVAEVLREALLPLADHIQTAFLYGSFAAERQGPRSDVDVMAIGDVPLSKVVEALAPAQERLGREINPTIYPVTEFRAKAVARHAFVAAVIRGPKIFLIESLAHALGLPAGQVRQLDTFRKKRNLCDYEVAGSVSDQEAE